MFYHVFKKNVSTSCANDRSSFTMQKTTLITDHCSAWFDRWTLDGNVHKNNQNLNY